MLHINKIGQVHNIQFIGINEINATNATHIKKALLPLLMQKGNQINLNFEGIVFIDNSGFQVLLAL
jgi:anti-anti-sigma regulatory factor